MSVNDPVILWWARIASRSAQNISGLEAGREAAVMRMLMGRTSTTMSPIVGSERIISRISRVYAKSPIFCPKSQYYCFTRVDGDWGRTPMPCMRTMGFFVAERCGLYQYVSSLRGDLFLQKSVCGRGGKVENHVDVE